ncbi:ATP-dependent DNA helicase RecG [Microbacter margulisiae]|uniref:ATP-dependent DNA helicase RecG n=1 Tax=Microbacter margulisiae TaxID=1350067 RepID=A0A7W5DTI4_9PORP|nr:ATP-dependent DNA helicase RecG [Microbacter margulisiae]MBB3188460.1 ATP-dependent DNA helicase RecG [Microbacter margulisiae]
MIDLNTSDIQFIPGIGPKRAELLRNELQIKTAEDLLYYFPYKYIDRSRFYSVAELQHDVGYVQLKGSIVHFSRQGEGRRQRLTARFADGTGSLELIWFQGIQYVQKQYQVDTPYIIFGKPTVFNGRFSIAHPEIESVDQNTLQTNSILQGYYGTTEKMKSNFLNSKAIQKIMFTLLHNLLEPIPETLPSYLIKKFTLMPLHEAISTMHFPVNAQRLSKAKQRIKFEELFYIQLSLLRIAKQRAMQSKGYMFAHVGAYFNTFYHHCLPFELTNAQKKVIREIRADVGSGHQMNRLLQGDVGSGKTLVALMVMLIAMDNGFQACIMAPTEILAIQHFETISRFLQKMNVTVGLLTGSTRKSDRVRLHEQLRAGSLHLLVGTHALLEDEVQFANLGLVVIDEQHRFGVAQRAKMWMKNELAPHILVMTATPIPRTLAMTLYGDLEVSVIDELPPGRKPIQTLHFYEKRRGALYHFIEQEITAGRQVYVVYPLIEESEKMDFQNLTDGFNMIKERFPKFSAGMVHGRLTPTEKEAAMTQFAERKIQILVATTVIEVGVNVPNASVMIIESAQRFGLSQLHQLRGRVGRGCDQSYCILMTPFELGKDTRKRMEIMTRTNDGFEIADADLKLRGPGDIEGTQQSGIPFTLRVANLARDGQMLQFARKIAMEMLEEDPLLQRPEHTILKKQLQKMQKGTIDWKKIS